MESLQLAQMLADISDLSAADTDAERLQDQGAANRMVSANKTLPTNPPHPQPHQINDQLNPSTSVSSGASRPLTAASAKRFDKFGRNILTPPAMSRTNSTGPPSLNPSTPGTPRVPELDDDIHQASTLMTLYEIRNRLKQQDSTGLKKAREQIDALIAKNKHQQQGGQADAHKSERPRPISRTYTYPRTESTTANTSEKK